MDNITKLIMDGEYAMDIVKATIFDLTKEKELVLFTMNEDGDPMMGTEVVFEEDLMTLPYCYYVGNDNYRSMATLQSIKGKDIKVLVQDDNGISESKFEEVGLDSFSFDQQIEILKLLNNR